MNQTNKARSNRKGKIMVITLGIIIALLALVGGNIYRQNQRPNIELGLENNKLKEIPSSPNCVSTQTQQKDKEVEPFNFKEDLQGTKAAVKEALSAYGDIEIMIEDDNYIYAVATTGKMKYHDDIEIYFDVDAQLVHYRSASRAGYSDMGLNKERYDALKEEYEK